MRPEIERCPICQKSLNIYYTEKRSIINFYIGKFTVHCIYLYCPDHKEQKFRPEEIYELTPKYCNYGYDILIHCGKALFFFNRTVAETVAELKQRNILISSSEVSFLAQKFIIYLAILHKESGQRLKEYMTAKGGYILHIDGTNEGASPHLISALDEISSIVLDNIKIATEKAEAMIPMLRKIKETFGDPLAIVHDMGKAMLNSTSAVFEGILNFICHFHFLKDIGNDLFEKEYSLVRSRLKYHGISTKLHYRIRQLNVNKDHHFDINQIVSILKTDKLPETMDPHSIKYTCYVLIEWAFEGKKHGDGFGFPFDRRHLVFHQRLTLVSQFAEELKQKYGSDCSKILKPVQLLSKDLQPITNDVEIQNILPLLLQKIKVFDKLRQAMHIMLPDSNRGLNDNGEPVEIKTIEKCVTDFRKWLIKKEYYHQVPGYQKMIEQIEEYWDKLFADPIKVKTENGEITIQPQRTNNISELFFRGIRRSYRKRTGNNRMAKFLQTMLKDTPLVKNLENKGYMKILLNGKTPLEERFAEVDSKIVREKLKQERFCNEKIPAKIKKIIQSKKSMNSLFNVVKLSIS